MRKYSIIALFLTVVIFRAPAQNLLKNPSFERGGMSRNHFPLLRVRNWRNPNLSSPDYLSNQEIHLDYKTPFGEKFIGLLYIDLLDTYDCEYAESAKFEEKLGADRIYCFRMHTYLDNTHPWASKEIQVAFTKHRSINRFSVRIMKKPNYIQFTDSSKLKVTGEWVHLAKTYQAKGGEDHLILGFFEDTIPLTRVNDEPSRYVPTAYYAFDNLELFEVADASECTCERPKQYYEADAIEFEDEFIVDNYLINNIQFELNSSKLTESSKLELQQLSQYLKQMYRVRVKIEGHTDTIGTDSANKVLSLRRAKSVKSFLIRHGVGPDGIRIKGYGSSKPVSDDPKKNRRVEILLLKP